MRILLVLALLLGVQMARAEESLCVGHEKIVFSCHLGSTILSCAGRWNHRGLDIPLWHAGACGGRVSQSRARRAGPVYTSSAPLFGGGETTLAFTRADYEYKISKKLGRADRGEPRRTARRSSRMDW